MSSTKEDLLARQKRLELERIEIKEGLPHLYSFKWYAWARAYKNSTNKMNLLCAANQISKSSTQIRKEIDWSTNKKLWQQLWRRPPSQFWQLYPSKDVATAEFELKWVKEFMPRGKFKDHPVYGWRAEYDRKRIFAIHWNSGIRTYFKTYEQDVHLLQSGTVDAIWCDEELPVELYDELKQRLSAVDGYFHMVFTATRNQELWYRAMEGTGVTEAFPDAFKLQVSKYDCLVYDDGTPSHWTREKIAAEERDCRTPTEALRRIHGKFVSEDGRKYPHYSPIKHYVKPFKITGDYHIVRAIDKGGGKRNKHNNHYSAGVYIAISPDFRRGYVYRGWRGDGIETTSEDVLNKMEEMRDGRTPMLSIYPHDAKDFGLIATRAGMPYTMANKSHKDGEDVLNTLFKNDALFIFDDDPELNKLGTELMTLMRETPKERAQDDLADALRYGAVAVPWDWAAIIKEPTNGEEKEGSGQAARKQITEAEREALEIAERRGEARPRETPEGDNLGDFQSEIAEWNEAYGT